MSRVFLCAFLIFFTYFSGEISFATPKFSPAYRFPTAIQARNTSYFTSINLILEAKYKSNLRLMKIYDIIEFFGFSVPTSIHKKKFATLIHATIIEYGTKKDLMQLIDKGEPVLVSTEISGKIEKNIGHISVAYSYESNGIWVSDPLDGKRKKLKWNEVFSENGKVKFMNFRTVSIKPYKKWNLSSKEKEKKEDIWIDETRIQ